MKKSLYITIGLVLCLLIFCAACGKNTTADNNTDPAPNPTPVTDPGGTGDNTTPLDSTADDKQNDTAPPDSTADDKQNDTTPPDSTADDKQNDDTQQPDSTADDKQGDNDTADNTNPDDTQKPDEVVAADYFASFDISKYDYSTNENNIKAVQAYYDFLFNNTEAYDTYTSKLVSLVDVAEDAYPRQSFWMNLQNLELAFVDFGADGVVEMVFNDGNRYFKNWVILFYENDQLYLDTVNHRSMGGIRKNGFYDSYAFFSSSFSVDGGQSDVSLFVCSTSKEYPYDKTYYSYFEIVDDEFMPTERTEITEVEYQSLLAAYNKIPEAVWYSVTGTFESILWDDIDHLMIFADINNQPTTMYNPK